MDLESVKEAATENDVKAMVGEMQALLRDSEQLSLQMESQEDTSLVK